MPIILPKMCQELWMHHAFDETILKRRIPCHSHSKEETTLSHTEKIMTSLCPKHQQWELCKNKARNYGTQNLSLPHRCHRPKCFSHHLHLPGCTYAGSRACKQGWDSNSGTPTRGAAIPTGVLTTVTNAHPDSSN